MKNTFHSLRPWAAALAAAVICLALFFFTNPAPGLEAAERIVGKWKRWQDFVNQHFAYPLPPMGPPPKTYEKPEERSLLPESCGSCHPDQYKQWKTSLHAGAMSPGIYGQLVDMWKNTPGQAQGCNECHAPLAEQQKQVRVGSGPFASWQKNPRHDKKLEMKGLACAACHVRNWRVHGPPKRETPPGVNDTTTTGAHGGVERTPFFDRAEFCINCHQHTFPGPNGKAIQNTYNEWKNSLWGKEDVPCQRCHMPKRRHLWRGIHDKDMTQGAVDVEVEIDKKTPREVVSADIRITNTGAGHHFPTYITPSVDVISELEDKNGKAIPGTRQIDVIERKLSANFSQEIRDTRIPAQKSITFRYRRGRLKGAARLRVRIHVRPDAFYHRFFVQYLRNPNISKLSRKLITQARDRAAKSAFDIYDERVDLKTGELL